jgi:retron-type reverse transcriptase
MVQGALLHVIEPIFERDFAPQSYGFRPGKGCKDALRRVEELLKGGYHWVVDADLKSYALCEKTFTTSTLESAGLLLPRFGVN